MATVFIRNIDDAAYERLKARAKQHRRSITQEAAFIIELALAEPANSTTAWQRVDRVREQVSERYGPFPDSVPTIREDRDR